MSRSENALRRDDFQLAQEYVEPRSKTEIELARMWRDAMGLDRIGIHDSFFDLGGKSFGAAVIFAEIERKLGVKLPMTILAELQTVALLAEKVDELSEQCRV